MNRSLKTLFQYIEDGNLKDVQTMIANNPTLLNTQEENQRKKEKGIKTTALVVAVQEQQIPIVEWLIKQGADVNHSYQAGMANCCDYTPLYEAINAGNIKIAELLLNAGAQPNTYNDCLADSPLVLAAHKNNIDMIKLLLSYATDINYQGPHAMGKTALMVAAGKGNLEIVRYLVEQRASVNLEDGLLGRTALSYAQKNKEVAQYLLDHGAHTTE